MNKIDIKYIDVPNICFSLTDSDDNREDKFRQQRIERGFDDSETWSLRDTIACFIIPRLERYIEVTENFIKRTEIEKQEINDFLESMKLISRDEGSCNWTDEEEIKVEKGLSLFPNIFMGLWW